MLSHSIDTSALCRIEECQDLVSDACVCDEAHQFMFLSLWGRDTAVHEFIARLTLGSEERGLERFHLVTPDDTTIAVEVADVHRLEKRTTRAFLRTLFGSVVHTWLFDSRCVNPDRANGSALAILPRDATSRTQRLWTLVQDSCPLPLLEHWRDTVLQLLLSRSMLSTLPFALGPVEGYRIALDIPALSAELGDMIRSNLLGIDDQGPLPIVAQAA